MRHYDLKMDSNILYARESFSNQVLCPLFINIGVVDQAILSA